MWGSCRSAKSELKTATSLAWRMNIVCVITSRLGEPHPQPPRSLSSFFDYQTSPTPARQQKLTADSAVTTQEKLPGSACAEEDHFEDARAASRPITSTCHANEVTAILMLSEAGPRSKHLIRWKNKEGIIMEGPKTRKQLLSSRRRGRSSYG